MQFVANGPDIPEKLLQAHEEGRAVFFCGAGISYNAGLQDFKWLVDEIYDECGTAKEEIEDSACQNELYDRTLNLLENRLPGQRKGRKMRKAIARVLRPDMNADKATDTHGALLQLARTRTGAIRLVTTNFDRLFEHVAHQQAGFKKFTAPLVPTPKDSQWDGLVYLHGLLPDHDEDERALDQLVVTSGDFGLAYLTEGWAARFVSELFRNYTVCFIGYSISDPVLRYMMDALAADRLRGEDTTTAYAIAASEPDMQSEEEAKVHWKAINVTPVLYDPGNGHILLHETIKKWAADYRDGVRGKERVVVECAMSSPSESTRQDDFTGRMFWALSDKTGLPAKIFADLSPAPTLEWLETFRLKPWMRLLCNGDDPGDWDNVIYHIARWLLRYLDDPDLIIWLTGQGGLLQRSFRSMIQHRLNHVEKLRKENKTKLLDKICAESPKALPRPQMSALWRLLLLGRIKSSLPMQGNYQWNWVECLKNNQPLTASLRIEIKELLSLNLNVTKPWRWDEENGYPTAAHEGQLPDCKLALTDKNMGYAFEQLDPATRDKILPELLQDFEQVLCDGLEMLRDVGEADDYEECSFRDMPSISPHVQNKDPEGWVVVTQLLRDSWLLTYNTDRPRATRIAQRWFESPYPLFKRLALFAASHEDCIESDEWGEWLLSHEGRWIWSTETRREVMRLLFAKGDELTGNRRMAFETVIRRGPPKAILSDGDEPDRWEKYRQDSIWVCFVKLTGNRNTLTDASRRLLDNEVYTNEDWTESRNDERNEFVVWTSGTGDPDYKNDAPVDMAPQEAEPLKEWLKQQPDEENLLLHRDTWSDTCREEFDKAFDALCELAEENFWPSRRWSQALQVWGEKDELIKQSWPRAGQVLSSAPDEKFREIDLAAGWWLNRVAQLADSKEKLLVDLCGRIVKVSGQHDIDVDSLHIRTAIMYPVGEATSALLNLWFKKEQRDNDALPAEIEHVFTRICETKKSGCRPGRMVLASQVVALFRADETWTKTNLLPFFDWAADREEASAMWHGFLLSPRMYGPLLLDALKKDFLETAYCYLELGDYGERYARCLTFAALEDVDDDTIEEFRAAIGRLPLQGLNDVATTLCDALEGAGEQREEYWKNRVLPFFKKIWPKRHELRSGMIVEPLACLCIAAGKAFPAALEEIGDWLQPADFLEKVTAKLGRIDAL